MANTLTSNLYPPLVDTSMPAFVRTQPCRIYFSLSDYNSESEIKEVHISLVNQDTNANAFRQFQDTTDETLPYFPNALKVASLQKDTTILSNEKYYVEISPNELATNEFGLNTFYKVQLRFSSIEAGVANENIPASYFTINLNSFSEWSTVCIIKGIAQPIIELSNLSKDEENIFTTSTLTVKGRMSYDADSNLESERLKQYELTILKNNDIIIESGIQYVNQISQVNEINYTFKYQLENSENYQLKLKYITNNLYTETILYNFIVNESLGEVFDGTIAAALDLDNGRVKINIKSNQNFTQDFVIKRTSTQTDFTIWDTIFTTKDIASLNISSFVWYDYTAEAGRFYKYSVQTIDGEQLGVAAQTEPIIVLLEDMFINANNKQLKIQYNPQVTSFKKNVLIGKVDTIGSKYPYIRKNGDVDYRSFSIGGIISCASDENDLFTSMLESYGAYVKLFTDYNSDNNITRYRDFIYEKYFREQVIDFLMNSEVKLFRSLTEGNILVKVMDVNLTPNQQLGRLVWTFTANLVEIDECSVDNYKKYNIQSFTGNSSAEDMTIITNNNSSVMIYNGEKGGGN